MTLTYEVAGHNPPLLLRGSNVMELSGSAPVRWILAHAAFEEHTLPLEVGDQTAPFSRQAY